MTNTADRPPTGHENPRHAVYVSDEKGLRVVTAANPGEETIWLEGVLYQHTREIAPNGRWVYTRVQ